MSRLYGEEVRHWYSEKQGGVWETLRLITVKERYWSSLASWMQGTIGVAVITGVLLIGMWSLRGGGNPSAVLAFLLINDRVSGPIASLGQLTITMGYLSLYMSRLRDYLDASLFALPLGRSGDGLLSVERAGASFGDRWLWKNVTLEVRKGERWIITGENGVGKTHFIRCLMGMAELQTGVVRWSSELAQGDIMYLPQTVPLIAGSLRDNLVMGQSVDDETCVRLLRELGWSGPIVLDRCFDELEAPSRGERQRIGVARLLLSAPKVAVVDEIEGGVDNPHALIEAVANAVPTMIAITHHPELWPADVRLDLPQGDCRNVRHQDFDSAVGQA